MWSLSVPWWQLVVRAVIIYIFLLILLRVTGKRQVGQLAPFDLVLLLVISNTVQNAMNAGDNSVTAGLLLATTVVAANFTFAWATWRSKRLEGLVEGHPVVVVHNGRINEVMMARHRLTRHELMSALRQSGCDNLSLVHEAVLENNGSITVVQRSTT
jgi:uncharacterized membrane protein YcaP (DUF421 family)